MFGINTTFAEQRLKPSKAQTEYICTKCNYRQNSAGKCPKDQTALSEVVTEYVCDSCNITQEKPGNCPKCGRFLKEVKKVDDTEVQVYTCKHCGRKLTVINPSAKCDVCGCQKKASECK